MLELIPTSPNQENEQLKLNKCSSEMFVRTDQTGDILLKNLKRARKLYRIINKSEKGYPEILIKENFIELLNKFYTYCQERGYSFQEVKKVDFQIFRFLNRLDPQKPSSSSFTAFFGTKVSKIATLIDYKKDDLNKILRSEYLSSISSIYNGKGLINITDFETIQKHIILIENNPNILNFDIKSYSAVRHGKGIMTQTELVIFDSQLTRLSELGFDAKSYSGIQAKQGIMNQIQFDNFKSQLIEISNSHIDIKSYSSIQAGRGVMFESEFDSFKSQLVELAQLDFDPKSYSSIQHGRGIMTKDQFGIFKSQLNDLDKLFVDPKSYSGIQNGKGVMTKSDFEIFKLQVTELKKSKLNPKSYTRKQAGKGIMADTEFRLFIKNKALG